MKNKHLENLKNKKQEIEKKIQDEENRQIPKDGELKFFEFGQNNSGGSFEVNEKLCHRLFIEAHNYLEAREKALNLGVYFDGCSIGIDCSCCGDRWYDSEYLIDLNKLSKDYKKEFKSIDDYAQHLANKYGWTSPDARIYFYNGKVKEIFKG